MVFARRVSFSRAMLCSLSWDRWFGQGAGDDDPATCIRSRRQLGANAAGSVLHDADAHALVGGGPRGEADAVVANGQDQAILGLAEMNLHLSGAAVFDRVVRRLLNDAV